MVSRPAGGFSARGALDTAWAVTAIVATAPLLAASAEVLGSVERLAAAGLLILTAWRPRDALLVLAGIGPVAATLGPLAGMRAPLLAWSVPVVVLGGVLALLAGRLPVRPRPAVAAAALVLAWLALASVAAQIVRDRVLYETAAEWQRAVRAFLDVANAGDGSWRRASAGVWLALQVLLVPLAVAALDRTGSRRLVAMLSVGAAAAGLVNVHRAFATGAQAASWNAVLAAVAHAPRVSAAFPDVNAAGSFFALAAAASGGLLAETWRERRRARAVIWAFAVLVGISALWLSGSRVAVAALGLAVLVLLVIRYARRGITRRRLAVIAAFAAAAAVVLVASNARRPGNDVPMAWLVRVEFVKTTWAMLKDHPVFGVGAGNYRPASPRYSSAALKRYYPSQNAHNNYLQVAGELGPLALLAFVLLTLVPLVDGARRLRTGDVAWHGCGLWAGVLAFELTWAAGHPLLIPEVAVGFFLALGALVAASGGGHESGGEGDRRAAWALAAAAGFVLLSFPARVSAERAALDLEHVILSGQRWVRGSEGPEVRFTTHLSLYVRAGDGQAVLNVKSPRARRPVLMSVYLDDQLVNQVTIAGAEWTPLTLRAPRRGPMEYRLVRLEAHGAPQGGTPALVLKRVDWMPDGTTSDDGGRR